MPILNYTTKISAMQTINEIQKKLVSHGAKSFLMEYEAAEPSGLAFIITTKHGDIPFRLPANIKSVRKVLEQQRVRRFVDLEMASRVAWRILKDWIEAQLAIIEAELVTLEQVFLPYMLMPGGDKTTLYEVIVEKGFYLKEGQDAEAE